MKRKQLQSLIREMLEQGASSYSFLPPGVTIDDFARVVRAKSVRWTSEIFSQKPLFRDEILRALDNTKTPLDRETVQFILDMYDRTIKDMDRKDVVGLMFNMETSLGLDLPESKDSELKDMLIAVKQFTEDVPYVSVFYYSRHAILALDPEGPSYRPYRLELFRQSIKGISPDFFGMMHKLIDANEFFSVPHKIDPEYAERVYDIACGGLEGLEQAIELVKSLEMSD